jgi:hypothetical protein
MIENVAKPHHSKAFSHVHNDTMLDVVFHKNPKLSNLMDSVFSGLFGIQFQEGAQQGDSL